MYEKDGEKYFIVDSHMHYWNAAPDNWVPGAEQYAKGWIECFHAYQGLGPAGDALVDRALPEVLRGRPDEGRLRGRLRGRGDLPADVPEGVVHGGLQHHRAQRARWARSTRASSSTTPGSTRATATRAWRNCRRNVERYGSKGVKLYTAEWNNGSRGYKLSDPAAYRFLEEAQNLGHQERPRAQGPDDLAAGQGRVRRLRRRPRGDRLPGAELHRRARGPAADRGLLLHGDAGAQRLRGPVGGHRRPDARPAEVLRQGHGRAAVLGRRGQDDLRQRLRHLGAEVAGRGLRRLGLPDSDEFSDYPQAQHRDARRRSSASTRPGSTTSRCPRSASFRADAGTPAAQDDAQLVVGAPTSGTMTRCQPRSVAHRRAGSAFTRRSRAGARPEARRADHHPRLRRVLHRLRTRAGAGPAAAAHLLLRTQLRLPDGGRRLRRGQSTLPGVSAGRGRSSRTTSPPTRSTPASAAGRASSPRSAARRRPSWTSCAPTFCARRCWPGTDQVCRPLLDSRRARRPSWPR